MRISLIQTDIAWEDKQENLRRLRLRLEELKGRTDLVVVPETFTTGFSMNADRLAEPLTGPTVSLLQQWASKYCTALAGSFIARHDDGTCRNRFFFFTPDGKAAYYDKRHLFRMGHEDQYFAPGRERPVISYRDFRILPQVCYDLRFPVWSRNRNDYDALLYVASWPASRIAAWDALLPARAIENQAYVLGVNRVGNDPTAAYNGHSAAFDFLGRPMGTLPDGEEGVVRATIDTEALAAFRDRFRAWADADDFALRI